MKNLYCPYCCGPLIVTTRTEGRPYLTYEVPDEIMCDNIDCGALWDPTGTATAPPWRHRS